MYTVYILKSERIQKMICMKKMLKSIIIFPQFSCCGKHLCVAEFKVHMKFWCKRQVLKFITSSACVLW